MKLNLKQKKSISRLVESCFDNNKIDDPKARLIIKQLKSLPDGQAIQAISFFLKKLRLRLEQNTILIESATRLSSQEIRQIVAQISKEHTVYQIQTNVNPSLITGIRVKIGNTVLEDSFFSRAEQLTNLINGWSNPINRTRLK